MRSRLLSVVWVVATTMAACSTPSLDAVSNSDVYRIATTPCADNGHPLSATGTLVAADLILTVAHVFDKARLIDVGSTDSDTGADGYVTALNEDLDLALVRVPSANSGSIVSVTSPENRPQEVFLLTPSGTEGPYLSTYHDSVEFIGTPGRAALSIDHRITPGMSGTGVLNSDGELIGVMFAVSEEADQSWATALTPTTIGELQSNYVTEGSIC